MCRTYTRVGFPRFRNSNSGGAVPATSRPTKSHGSTHANVASRSVSPASSHANENCETFVRAVASAVRKCNRATSGSSGALNSSAANAAPGSRGRSGHRGAAPTWNAVQASTAHASAAPVTPTHHRYAASGLRMRLRHTAPTSGTAIDSSAHDGAKIVMSRAPPAARGPTPGAARRRRRPGARR
jgi:hypothetical protein